MVEQPPPSLIDGHAPAMPAAMWTFQARLERVIDADTMRLSADLGMNTYRTINVRLLGINAPEIRGVERPSGLVAKVAAAAWFDARPETDWPLLITTRKDPDSFGRYLAWVYDAQTGECLNEMLFQQGYAVEYQP